MDGFLPSSHEAKTKRERERDSFRGNFKGEFWCFAAFPPFNNTRLKDRGSEPLPFEF